MELNKNLFDEFYGEHVGIVTNIYQTVTDETGMAQVPVSIDGEFIDLDDNFLLLSGNDGSPKLISLKSIVTIEIVSDSELQALMETIKGGGISH